MPTDKIITLTGCLIFVATLFVSVGCGTSDPQSKGTLLDQNQTQISGGYRVIVTTTGGVSTNGIWHASTTDCDAFLWIDSAKEASSGVCLHNNERIAPTVRCAAGKVIIEAQPNAKAKSMMLTLNNGEVITGRVISIPTKTGILLAYYYQTIPRRGSLPRTLDEITDHGESNQIRLSTERGCSPREVNLPRGRKEAADHGH
jgi:hypothetical protein